MKSVTISHCTGLLPHDTFNVLLGVVSEKDRDRDIKAFSKALLTYNNWYEETLEAGLEDVLRYLPEPDYLYSQLECDYMYQGENV